MVTLIMSHIHKLLDRVLPQRCIKIHHRTDHNPRVFARAQTRVHGVVGVDQVVFTENNNINYYFILL